MSLFQQRLNHRLQMYVDFCQCILLFALWGKSVVISSMMPQIFNPEYSFNIFSITNIQCMKDLSVRILSKNAQILGNVQKFVFEEFTEVQSHEIGERDGERERQRRSRRVIAVVASSHGVPKAVHERRAFSFCRDSNKEHHTMSNLMSEYVEASSLRKCKVGG